MPPLGCPCPQRLGCSRGGRWPRGDRPPDTCGVDADPELRGSGLRSRPRISISARCWRRRSRAASVRPLA
eukprot:12601068-Alexandrium_andersonii.AAC.1